MPMDDLEMIRSEHRSLLARLIRTEERLTMLEKVIRDNTGKEMWEWMKKPLIEDEKENEG